MEAQSWNRDSGWLAFRVLEKNQVYIIIVKNASQLSIFS